MTKREVEIAALRQRRRQLENELTDIDTAIAAAQYAYDREYNDYYDRMDANESCVYAKLSRVMVVEELRSIVRRLHCLRRITQQR